MYVNTVLTPSRPIAVICCVVAAATGDVAITERDSVTAAFVRAWERDTPVRLHLCALFMNAAFDGRISQDLEVMYQKMDIEHDFDFEFYHDVDQRREYMCKLARRPCFRFAALYDASLHWTPLGALPILLLYISG